MQQKLHVEAHPASANDNSLVRRPSNAIGKDVHASHAGRQSPIIETGNLDSIRDFIDVADVARLYVRLMQRPRARGEIVHVCTGEGTSLRDILGRMIKRSGLIIELRGCMSLVNPRRPQ